MALNPQYLDSLPNTLVDMYSLVEIDILEDMARRISTYDYFIPAALHQNQKLQELGLTQQYIIEALSGMTGQTQQEIVDLLTEAGAEAVADDVEYYTRAEVYKPDEINTEALHKQLNSGLLQTQQAFKNITATTANTATKQFENALDRAWTQINVGGMDYNTAIHNAIKDLSKQGIGAIQYPSGRVDSLEVAVRRAVVTGANQTAAKVQEALADELDVDLVEVTAHGGARPAHAKWQGKCYSRKGKQVIDGVVYEDFETVTRYGHGDGLGGWNCRHNFHPYIHGTARTWNDEKLKDLDKKNISYNGETYTEYEASQIQRGIERDIRSLKRQIAAIEAGGGDASEERAKLRKANKAYTDFTEQTGLKKQQARTKVATGTGKLTPTPKTKTATINNVLTKTANNDIISDTKDDERIKAVKQQPWFDKDLKQEEQKEVMRALEKTTEGERKFLAAYGGKIKGDLYNGSGYYSPVTKTIHLDISKVDERSKRIGYDKDVRLFFHEAGHLFDYNILNDGTKVREHLPDLKKKLRADAIGYINKLFSAKSLTNVKRLTNLTWEQKSEVAKDLYNDKHLKNAVSDLFGGLSGNQLQGGYGHSKSYWKGDAVETEAVAHMFEAKYMKGERLDVFKKYFPTAYEYFSDFIEREVEDKL